jgi:hypothetical protein
MTIQNVRISLPGTKPPDDDNTRVISRDLDELYDRIEWNPVDGVALAGGAGVIPGITATGFPFIQFNNNQAGEWAVSGFIRRNWVRGVFRLAIVYANGVGAADRSATLTFTTVGSSPEAVVFTGTITASLEATIAYIDSEAWPHSIGLRPDVFLAIHLEVASAAGDVQLFGFQIEYVEDVSDEIEYKGTQVFAGVTDLVSAWPKSRRGM